MSPAQIDDLVNSLWAWNRSGPSFTQYQTPRTQLMSYLSASYGLLEKKTAALTGTAA